MTKFPLLSAMVVAVALAIVTLAVWAAFNRPSSEPPWPDVIQGIALSPYRLGQDPTLGDLPTEEQIEDDLALLENKTYAVRTYSTEGALGELPRIAARHHLNVAMGAWLDKRLQHNEREIRGLLAHASERNVVRLIVGNEVLLRGDLTLHQLTGYLDRVRKVSPRLVSTADTWDTWLRYPELARHVDFITVHILPFWEGVPVEKAVQFAADKMDELQRTFPGMPIVIGEIGWPSEGRSRVSARASEANEAMFLRRFLRYAQEQHYIYYIEEAFDQPWKRKNEGAVGEYWGIWDVNRNPKFPLREPIVRVPEWRLLAGISISVGIVLLSVLYLSSRTLGTEGRTFLAVVVYSTATIAVWTVYDYLDQYLTATGMVVGGLLTFSMLGVIAVLLAEAHEWAEARWAASSRPPPRPSVPPGEAPLRVSIHVPAYNEPPEMLKETLDALSRLDYPDFEVVVVDNNTVDEAVWRPVEAHCAQLGPRFRFFHVAPLAGFKAGALNFALQHTDPAAAIIAVLDSDYVVERNWLKDLVPAFADPDVTLVQAPQDYRDQGRSFFKSMCYWEYRGFFYIGMITRNERNAIIQHGTMTMVRRETLDRLHGWAEWCITEDAELGLRIFADGREAEYVSRSYGKGLMPDTFLDYKKQRYRWAYGAMQILKHHAGKLLTGRRARLTPGQRYHFVAGWLPWIADGANLLFNIAALAWTSAMLLDPAEIDAPVMVFSALPLALFAFKLAKLVHLYTGRVGANLPQTLSAALAGLSVSHTIGCAVLRGLFTRDEPFYRTPKFLATHPLLHALKAARDEILLLGGLLMGALTLNKTMIFDSQETHMWVVVLTIQSIPYGAAVLTALLSVTDLPARLLGGPKRDLPGPRAYQAIP